MRLINFPSLTGVAAEAIQSGIGSLHDPDAIVTATSTETSELVLSFDDDPDPFGGNAGVIGIATMLPRRGISVTSSSTAGAFSTLVDIVVVGELVLRNGTAVEVSAAAQLTQANGGETVDFPFPAGVDRVKSITIPPMADTDGTLSFGVGDLFAQFDVGRGSLGWRNKFRYIRAGAAGNIIVGYGPNQMLLTAEAAGDVFNVDFNKVHRVGTTVTSFVVGHDR